MPYDNDVFIKNSDFEFRVLSLCEFFYNTLYESLTAFFVEKNLLKFDAHVGENSCQIRAIFLIELSSKYNNTNLNFYKNHVSSIKKNLEQIKNRISIVSTGSYRRSFDKKFVTLNNYLSDLELLYEFSYDIYILCISYFLTKYRGFDKNENIYITYKLILNFPKNIFRKIVHIYQIELSKYSVNYIKNIASGFMLRESVNLLVERDDDGRFVLPCFLINKIIMMRLADLKINIAFFVRDVIEKTYCYIFEYHCQKSRYVYTNNLPLSESKKQSYVIHVTAGLEHRFLKMMIKNLQLEYFIDLKMAIHPQYGGLKLRALKNNPYRHSGASIGMQTLQRIYVNHKINSRQLLNCQQSYNLLNIKHMFADSIINQINMSKNNAFYIDQMARIWFNLPKISEVY